MTAVCFYIHLITLKYWLLLQIPNHLVWLIFFYLMFHSFLNLVGELLHFADRNFYSDWWNANNIDLFWRTWNMPVHRWAVRWELLLLNVLFWLCSFSVHALMLTLICNSDFRHLYIPLVEIGYSRTAAGVAVFFVSAFFHEYLVSVPLRTYKTWAFMGMMAQASCYFNTSNIQTEPFLKVIFSVYVRVWCKKWAYCHYPSVEVKRPRLWFI